MMSKRAALACLRARPIAHRGLHGCGRPGAPIENTIGAAQAAIAARFGIECDVQLSADGEAIVFHDTQIDRLTTGTGPISALTTRELATLRVKRGHDRIPTLADFLAAIGGRVPLVIELKVFAEGPHLVERVMTLLGAYQGVVALESFDADVIAAIIAKQPPYPVGLVGPSESAESVDEALCRRCDFLSWSIDHLPDIAGRRFGVPLTTWTVRTPEQCARAAADEAQIVFEGFMPS